MPKTLVLVSNSPRAAVLAGAIVEGASSVRFAEVDVRRLPDSSGSEPAKGGSGGGGSNYRSFEGASHLANYDAIVIAAEGAGDDATSRVKGLLEEAGALFTAGQLVDKVGAAFTIEGAAGQRQESANWPVMMSLGRMGMLLVTPGNPGAAAQGVGGEAGSAAQGVGEAVVAAARDLGKRVASVTAMVTHARSHHHHH